MTSPSAAAKRSPAAGDRRRPAAKAGRRDPALKALTVIPGIGPSIGRDLLDLGIRKVSDLRGKDPERLYRKSNAMAGLVQDRCLLYAFRCAVYYAETEGRKRDPEKLKWWNWKDGGTRK